MQVGFALHVERGLSKLKLCKWDLMVNKENSGYLVIYCQAAQWWHRPLLPAFEKQR